MEQYAFIVGYVDGLENNLQLVIAASYKDAYETFQFENLEKNLKISVILSLVDIQKKIEELELLGDNSKLIENEKNELIEVKESNKIYNDIEVYMTKKQLQTSFISLLNMFDQGEESYLVSSNIDVEWK